MNRTQLTNLVVAVTSAFLATLLTMGLSSESGWAKFLAWMILFVAIQSPFVMSSRNSYRDCTAWLRRKKAR
jgi:hypothetical protein